PGLKDILAAARVISIEPQSSETRVELLKRQFREESGDVIRRQSLEIEELRREVDRLQRGESATSPFDDTLEIERGHVRELERRIEGLEAENAGLRAQFEQVRTSESEANRLEEELKRTRSEAGTLRGQVDS